MGLTPAQIQQAFGELDEAEEPDDEEEFVVWQENSRALDVFLMLSSQWSRFYTFSGQIVWECLPYDRVMALLRELEPKRKRRMALLQDIRTMESAAMRELNKQDS